MSRLPKFVVIGAMKSATSTLYAQLSRQDGIFLTALDEPNFFSNDEQYSKGIEWYCSLFEDAAPSNILGEVSTHYTKLPTYPQTVTRMRKWLDRPQLVYIMRNPVDRLVSQYIHQWSEGQIHCDLQEALERHPELIAYSCYAKQLAPFFEAYGKSAILPVFFERLIVDPQGELERICRFIGHTGTVQWDEHLSRRNVSAERIRKFPLYDLLIETPWARSFRHLFVPKWIRTKVRHLASMKQRPAITGSALTNLEQLLDEDLARVGDWLGIQLDCQHFRAAVSGQSHNWQ
jgi:hypothetical protein